jgi:hypothetical protein
MKNLINFIIIVSVVVALFYVVTPAVEAFVGLLSEIEYFVSIV